MRRSCVLALAFTLSALAILIPLTAGSLRPKTEDQIDGLQHFQTMEVITGKDTTWSEDWKNLSAWFESSSPGADTKTTFNHSLTLSVNFSSASSVNIAQLYRNTNLTIDNDTSLDITLSVSAGADYGIYFHGQYPNGTLFSTANDGSYLQNRQGLGRTELISSDLLGEAYLARIAPAPALSISPAAPWNCCSRRSWG